MSASSQSPSGYGRSSPFARTSRNHLCTCSQVSSACEPVCGGSFSVTLRGLAPRRSAAGHAARHAGGPAAFAFLTAAAETRLATHTTAADHAAAGRTAAGDAAATAGRFRVPGAALPHAAQTQVRVAERVEFTAELLLS